MPMRIYPAIHYTMGGLWVDYNLMSTIPGLHVLGEANFSDHGANRLGASALMQGLADGYFVIPYTLAHYLGSTRLPAVTHRPRRVHARPRPRCRSASTRCSPSRARRRRASSIASSAQLLWDEVGMARNDAGLRRALDAHSRSCATSSGRTCRCPGPKNNLNKNLEYAGRVADYLEFAEVLTLDALHRTESCGGHFREESQTPDGEALRDDEHFSYVAAWEFQGVGKPPALHKEPLVVRVREADPEELQVDAPVASCQCQNWQDSRAVLAVETGSWKLMRSDQCAFILKVWRQAGPTAAGRARRLHGRERLARHVLPRDARRRQRGADREGRGPDRVRLGLPRGHLRRLRVPDQRRAARAGSRARPSASCTCGASRTTTG